MTDLSTRFHNVGPYDPKAVLDIDSFADWLRWTYAHKFKRRDELIAAVEEWKTLHPHGIADDLDHAASTDQLAQILTEVDQIEKGETALRKVAKEPFVRGGQIVDAVLKHELADRLSDASKALSVPMKAYLEARQERLRKEAAEAAEKAAREAAEAQRALSAASTDDDLDAALDADQAAQDAAAMAAARPVSAPIRGDLGTSSGLRGTWKVVIDDPDLVPRQYLTPNLPVIEAAMRASRADKGKGAPALKINGVRFVLDTTLNVRR